jgi:hypothetical protein
VNCAFDIFLGHPVGCVGRGGVGFGRVCRRYGQQYLFSQCFVVSISGGVGNFVPVVMVVQRGDAAGVLGLFQILVSYSHFQ